MSPSARSAASSARVGVLVHRQFLRRDTRRVLECPHADGQFHAGAEVRRRPAVWSGRPGPHQDPRGDHSRRTSRIETNNDFGWDIGGGLIVYFGRALRGARGHPALPCLLDLEHPRTRALEDKSSTLAARARRRVQVLDRQRQLHWFLHTEQPVATAQSPLQAAGNRHLSHRLRRLRRQRHLHIYQSYGTFIHKPSIRTTFHRQLLLRRRHLRPHHRLRSHSIDKRGGVTAPRVGIAPPGISTVAGP